MQKCLRAIQSAHANLTITDVKHVCSNNFTIYVQKQKFYAIYQGPCLNKQIEKLKNRLKCPVFRRLHSYNKLARFRFSADYKVN